MNNSKLIDITDIKSNNLEHEINLFKNKFLNKPQYFICEHDMVGIIMNKYIFILKNFILKIFSNLKKSLFIKIFRLIKKRSIESSKLLSKFELLEQKLDNQQLIIERSFKLNSKLQKEVDIINTKIDNNFGTPQLDSNKKQPQIIGHNSNTKIDFYQEENLRLGSELVDTKKKFEILKNEIEKYENQRSNLISKINSVNDVINDTNVLTNVFENKVQPKVNILDPQSNRKNDKIDLNEQVKAIFLKKV